MKLFRCSACGYVHEGDDAPERCPKCGAPKEKFAAIDEAETKLIERSKFTNSLHCQLMSIMEEVISLADAGIDDDLDPPCVALFRNAKQQAIVIAQSAKAELRGHVNKGKWG